jgi:SAM-dependent methyltransferase
MEANYLRRSITVSCKQQQLQIGGLGWENEFVDFSLYRNYVILDGKAMGDAGALKVTAKAFNLPIQTESMDLVVLPHILEFDARRFQTLREVNRILKPGGELVMLNFNPFSLSVRFQFLWDWKLADSWRAHFITKARVLDWLKLMNFELLTTAEFGVDSYTIAHGKFEFYFGSVFDMAYGVKAVKRRYTLIPLAATQQRRSNLATVGLGLKLNLHRQDNHD